jgi:AraC-like DNA-binding protein
MAGFHQRAPALWDMAMVAHPSVTLLIDLSGDSGATYALAGAGCPHGGAAQRGGDGDRTVGAGPCAHGSVVAGLLPGAIRATGWARVECLQIRLSPATAAALTGDPVALTGAVVALEDIWGRDAARAEDMLRAAPTWNDRFALAESLLRKRLAGRRPVDPEVAHLWRRTMADRGRERVESLAGEVGWSRKRLWSRFRSQLGITPKRAARLIRFDHAAHLLAAGRPPAEVAAAGGYADQSHLHRESRAFTGLTLTAVAAAPWLAIDPVAWPSPPGPSPGGPMR